MLHRLSQVVNEIFLPHNHLGDWEANNSPVTWVTAGSSIITYQPNGTGFLVISPSKGSAYIAWRRIFRKYSEIRFTKKNVIITNNPVCENDVKHAFHIKIESYF